MLNTKIELKMMKKGRSTWSAMLLALLLTGSIVACKSKVSDADLQAKVETVTAGSPNVVVGVAEGVVTLTGTVATEEEKNSLGEAAKNADANNVKSVVNELIIDQAPIQTNSDDADLITKVIDATKDYPTVNVDVKDGVITVTGSIEQTRVQPLKMALDALNPKKVDMSALSIN